MIKLRLQNSLFILVALMIVSSCSIEKRVYNKGYYVQWKNRTSNKGDIKEQKPDIKNEDLTILGSEDEIQKDQDSILAENINDAGAELKSTITVAEQEDQIENAVRKQSLSQLIKLPSSVLKSEIRKEFNHRKDQTVRSQAPRKLSPVIKLAIIFTGLGIIALIIAFWAWYFYFLGAIAGAATVPVYKIFLISGLISLALGLVLFIGYWLFH